MDIQQKIQLINQLDVRIGWLIRAYVKRYTQEDGYAIVDSTIIDEIDFIGIDIGEDAPTYSCGVLDRSKMATFTTIVKEAYGSDVTGIWMGYDFIAQHVRLEISKNGSARAESSVAPESLLEYFDEAEIRRGFAENEEDFLRLTKTTLSDWRIED